MYIKSLTISNENKIFREINFRKGINLIVDETPFSEEITTGNNVGKTTVLKLIDFCFGAEPKTIYTDVENKKANYTLVKNFLEKNKILITLTLTEDLDNENAEEIVIERNFLSRNKIVRKINGKDYTENEFESELLKLIFSRQITEKPTLREIISHNIRYKDESINNTLKTISYYTSDAQYETLYLFLFGCDYNKGNAKQSILTKLNQEYTFKSRLEKNQTKNAYETALSLIEDDIVELNKKKLNLNLNENFEQDLDKLNNIKYQINKASSEISKQKLRKELILEAQQEMNKTVSNIDLNQLHQIYQQSTKLIGNLQKTFDDLVSYHNIMINEKIKFITKELPILESQIKNKNENLKKLLTEEKKLTLLISKTDSFEVLEELINKLNEKFRQKGEYENIIQQINDVEKNIREYKVQLDSIDNELFSDEFEHIVKNQIFKFNKHFSFISNKMYGEQYAIKYEIITNKKNQRLYKFSAFNTNFSSGKKQGEISSFDIAYILFAEEENILCLHFLLNDKKELMYDLQLVKIAEIANENNIQFVASILKDKLPPELNKEEYFIVKLSQNDKLFRIE